MATYAGPAQDMPQTKDQVIAEILENDQHIMGLLSQVTALREKRSYENESMAQRLEMLENMMFSQIHDPDPADMAHASYVNSLRAKFEFLDKVASAGDRALGVEQPPAPAPAPEPSPPPEPPAQKEPPKDFFGREIVPPTNTWQNYCDHHQVGTFGASFLKAAPMNPEDNTYIARGQPMARHMTQEQGRHWLHEHYEDHHSHHLGHPLHHSHAKHHGEDSLEDFHGTPSVGDVCKRVAEPVSKAFSVY